MSKSRADKSETSPDAPRSSVCKVMAACLALAAFSVAVLGGLFAANPPHLILSRALIAMILCYPVGYIIGLVCDRVLEEHIKRYQQEHPVPEERSPENSANTVAENDEEEIITV